jgi:hypothetical protein
MWGRRRIQAPCSTTSCASTASAQSTCPIFKQGGNSNTITIVNGIKAAVKNLVDIPSQLKTAVVFDQSVFVKLAIANVGKEALIGLVLTGIMILIFLGSSRATLAVLLRRSAFGAGLPDARQLPWAGRSTPCFWADWRWSFRA